MERHAGAPIAPIMFAVCLAFAPGNAGAQPYDPPPSNFTAYWEVPAFKDHP